MDYFAIISGSVMAVFLSVVRDHWKAEKSKKSISAYAAPDFSENKGKAIIIIGINSSRISNQKITSIHNSIIVY